MHMEAGRCHRHHVNAYVLQGPLQCESSQTWCIVHRSFFQCRKIWHLWSRVRWLIWKRTKPKVVIRRFRKRSSKSQQSGKPIEKSPTRPNPQTGSLLCQNPIRIATFNVALFALAPALPKAEKSSVFIHKEEDYLKLNSHPKSILKQSPLHQSFHNSDQFTLQPKSKLKVSINLPDNEISLAHSKVLSFAEEPEISRSQVPMRSPICFPSSMINWMEDGYSRGSRTIFDVLKEVDADILALQDVKAEEEKNMQPLSDLANALGMNYVFAESWAPEYGNAILSKWPIKKWKVQKIFDDQDFRNVLKATIDVPRTGEINVYCTQLDHLDENWRMKQINAIIQSSDRPHILAGGLNSLNASDYASERWADIVRYYEEVGKPTPRTEVMNLLKGKEYADAKDFAGECEPVVIIAKGQNVQGTCKYGTRVDYVLASKELGYKFVPGSYSVISSKGTSDHHLVQVDIMKGNDNYSRISRRKKKFKQQIANFRNYGVLFFKSDT